MESCLDFLLRQKVKLLLSSIYEFLAVLSLKGIKKKSRIFSSSLAAKNIIVWELEDFNFQRVKAVINSKLKSFL